MAAERLGLQVLELAAEAATEAMFGDQPERSSDAPRRGTVWVSADGMMIHDRSSGTEFEVKVGLVFDGALRVGRTRRALTGRTYVGGTGSWMRFAERLTATCAGLGVFDAERILFVSDGAVAIRWIRERSFPTAIELLDWFHLVEQLRWAIGPERADRLAEALAVAEPGNAVGLSSSASRLGQPRPTPTVPSGPPSCARPLATWPPTAVPSRATGSSPGPRRDRWRKASTSWCPPLQGARDELVPALREPAPEPSASPPQRHLGALLVRAVRDCPATMAVSGVSQHRRRDASKW